MEFKISVVVTVRDDEEGIKRLLADLEKQTVKPDEVVVVKAEKKLGESKENKDLKRRGKEKIKKKVIYAGKYCSRGKGRNIGIRMARNEFIAVTDAGCRPHKEWLERITAGLNKGPALRPQGRALLVVAGWYKAVAETGWQKSFAPYLVPERVNKGPALPQQQGRAFLPASRSIAFTKKAWGLVGGYPEEPVSGGEDLKFADNLYKNPEVNIIFAPDALVDWPVPATLEEFIKDMVKHTRGNFEAGYWPHIFRNLSVVGRWILLLMIPWLIPIYLIVSMFNKGPALPQQQGRALRALRMIAVRVAADAAVVYGTVIGIIDKWVIKKLRLRVSGG